MDVLIGCDVDPVLPRVLDRRPEGDIWECVRRVHRLVDIMGSDLPVVTWLIRADESVRFCTGAFASGFTSHGDLWDALAEAGHELGWHMHLMSFDSREGAFRFDPQPAWLPEAYEALSQYYPVRATRTGWDYGSNFLFEALEALGVAVDFSALPGNIAWYVVGRRTLVVDWLECAPAAYYPSRTHYQRQGDDPLRILEIPIAQFPLPALARLRRLAWRARHRCWSVAGLGNKTRLLTEHWDALPPSDAHASAFHFHPADLTTEGLGHFVENVRMLRERANAQFVTASAAAQSVHHDSRRD